MAKGDRSYSVFPNIKYVILTTGAFEEMIDDFVNHSPRLLPSRS